MMEKSNENNALKKALDKRMTERLPADFSTRVMAKVCAEANRRQKRNTVFAYLSLSAASLFLIGFAIYSLWDKTNLISKSLSLFLDPLMGFYGFISLLSLCLLVLDFLLRHWLKKDIS